MEIDAIALITSCCCTALLVFHLSSSSAEEDFNCEQIVTIYNSPLPQKKQIDSNASNFPNFKEYELSILPPLEYSKPPPTKGAKKLDNSRQAKMGWKTSPTSEETPLAKLKKAFSFLPFRSLPSPASAAKKGWRKGGEREKGSVLKFANFLCRK